MDRTTECGFEGVTAVTANDLTGDDRGALEPGETGYVGHCHCGWSSRIRYSRVSAKGAVAGHALNLSPHAMNLGAAAAISDEFAPNPAPGARASEVGTAGTRVDPLAGGTPGLAVPTSSETR